MVQYTAYTSGMLKLETHTLKIDFSVAEGILCPAV